MKIKMHNSVACGISFRRGRSLDDHYFFANSKCDKFVNLSGAYIYFGTVNYKSVQKFRFLFEGIFIKPGKIQFSYFPATIEK